MAAAVIVPIITAAAEQFAQRVAQDIGQGMVEALFNQKKIAPDLESIKQQLAELSEFIRRQLPALINQAVDAAIARKVEFDIVEKAISIKGAIRTLNEARENGVAKEAIPFYVANLIRHADDVAEMGGTLISYGQPYYASVAVSFAALLTAYAAAIREAPEHAAGLRVRSLSWQPRLESWIDAKQPTSFVAIKQYWEYVYGVGAKVIPTFEVFNTGAVRRVVYTYTPHPGLFGGPAGILVHWAWFGLYKRADGSIYMDGNHSASLIPNATSIQDAITRSSNLYLTLPEPEWWDIEAHSFKYFHGRAGYDQMVPKLAALRDDYYHHYHVKYPVVSKAAELVSNLKQQLMDIVSATSEDSTPENLTPEDIDLMILEQVKKTSAGMTALA